MNLVKANPTIAAVGNFLVNFVLSGNGQEGHPLSGQDVRNKDTAHSFLPLLCETPETHLQRQEWFQPVLPAASGS